MNLDAHILKILQQPASQRATAAELARNLGVSRTTFLARIEALRELGYEIQASPHLGYQLVSVPDVLHADYLTARLGKTKVIGRDMRVFRETASTNDVIEKLARDGSKEGVVVFAESQSRGRGRLGRKWVSPAKKGLWFSVLLRPELDLQQITQLTVGTATALRRAIQEHTGLKPVIKWPNDIFIAHRKVAGILTELHAELERVQFVVVGIGVDVNLSPGDFPAALRPISTSLKIQLGRAVSRAELAVAVLRALDEEYDRIIMGQFSEVAEEWEEHCATLGKEVVTRVGARQIRGRAESLGEDGALLLRTEHGHLERIVAGDVIMENLG